jgi:biopolymer transport protein ExbD
MDVMFLVLIFFIYCMFDMAVHRGLKVDLPDGRGVDEKGERIVVTIKRDDSVQFNGMDMSRDSVVKRITELKKVGMDLPVLISGDRSSSLGMGISILSDLKSAGIDKVSFQVSGTKTVEDN